jgi:hypothetical protein
MTNTGTATLVSSTVEIVIRTEEAEEVGPLYPEIDQLVAAGPREALGTLHRQVSALSHSDNSGGWERIIFSLLHIHPEVIIVLAEGEPEGEVNEDLRDYTLRVGILIRTAFLATAQVWNSRLQFRRLGGPSLTEEENFVTTRFPLLLNAENDIMVRVHLLDSLIETAKRLGGPWLLFAPASTIQEIADENPGSYLGEIGELGEQAKKVTFNFQPTNQHLNILRAFLA